MDDPVRPNPKLSKVIDQLHQQIDLLKEELDTTKMLLDEFKKKYALVAQKNELIVDQLANVKHENDMINALLKRKERRILDLEEQVNELLLATELLQMSNKNMKIRCDNLAELLAALTADHERLKIAYDALLALQNEYKKHYQKELADLADKFQNFRRDNEHRYELLQLKLTENDKDVDALLDSLTNKRKTMDNLYVNKNKAVVDVLTKLATVARAHGQELKLVLEENVQTIKGLKEKHPDLADKIQEHEAVQIDLDELLLELQELLLLLFDDEELATPNRNLNSHQPQENKRNLMAKRRKSKRNLMRFDLGKAPDFSHIQTPQTPLLLPKRPYIPQQNQNRQGRTPTPPQEDFRGFVPGHHHLQLMLGQVNRLFSTLLRHGRQALLLNQYQFGGNNQYNQQQGYQPGYKQFQNNHNPSQAQKRRLMLYNKRNSSQNFDLQSLNYALNNIS